jgi:hypothetical protein
MNPEVTVPLTIGAVTADFEKAQLLAGFTSLQVAASDRGSAAIGVKDSQPERLFRCLPCTQVRDRVGRGLAPWEILVAYPRVDGELEAVRISTQTAYGDGRLKKSSRHQAISFGLLSHPCDVLPPSPCRCRTLGAASIAATAARSTAAAIQSVRLIPIPAAATPARASPSGWHSREPNQS